MTDKNLKYLLFVSLIILVILIIIINPMDTKLELDKLDKKMKITDYIAVFALILTLLGTSFSIYYRDKQNKLLKIQRDSDQINIALSNQQSESAKKDAALATENAAKSNEKAANAELKSKQLEMELIKLRLTVSDRFVPINVFSSISSKLRQYTNKKALILCAISNDKEPIEFSNKLKYIFVASNWTCEVINQNNVRIPAPTGFYIFVDSKNKDMGDLFYNEFKDIGYECYLNLQENNSRNDITIQIWSK